MKHLEVLPVLTLLGKKKSSSNLGTVSNAFSYTEEIQTDCKYLSIFLDRGHWLCKLDRDRFFDPG